MPPEARIPPQGKRNDATVEFCAEHTTAPGMPFLLRNRSVLRLEKVQGSSLRMLVIQGREMKWCQAEVPRDYSLSSRWNPWKNLLGEGT